jgi:endonuclease YncB( thermonuclease family)
MMSLALPCVRTVLGAAAAVVGAAWAVAAAATTPDLVREPGGTVVAAIDGDTVTLADGREVRLVGIQAPKLPLGRPNFKAWPFADEAKAALEAIALQRTVTLGFGGARSDRHGRVLAHLFVDDRIWVQGELLKRGLARVYTFADNRAAVPAMLALEREARHAGRAIWRHPFYRVRSAAEAERHLDSFELVEGLVLAAARVGARTYLNFGADFKTDFTVAIGAADRKRFVAAGLDPLALQNRRVRVRGWIKSMNGPMIEATHPEQIELLDE